MMKVGVAQGEAPNPNRMEFRSGFAAAVVPRHSPTMQRTTAQGNSAELEGAMETLNISHGQVQEGSRGSDQHQHHGSQAGSQQTAQTQAGGAPKAKASASDEEVWYLKSIEFTSPSGETRTYNVITQNYNGCVVSHFYSVTPGLQQCPDV
jgi:hypothetical protein